MGPLASPFLLMTPSPQCKSSFVDADSDNSAYKAACRALGLSPLEGDTLAEMELASEQPHGRGRFCSNGPLSINDVCFPDCFDTCAGSPIPLMTPSPQYEIHRPCAHHCG